MLKKATIIPKGALIFPVAGLKKNQVIKDGGVGQVKSLKGVIVGKDGNISILQETKQAEDGISTISSPPLVEKIDLDTNSAEANILITQTGFKNIKQFTDFYTDKAGKYKRDTKPDTTKKPSNTTKVTKKKNLMQKHFIITKNLKNKKWMRN